MPSDALIKAVAAALAARARSQASPQAVSVPQTSFGTDFSSNINPTFGFNPAQIQALKIVEGLGKIGNSAGLDVDLQSRIAKIENNQVAAGLAPHHSFLGSALNRVGDILSRPIYAVGAFEDEGRTANQEGAGFWDTLAAAGKGAWHGFSGKSKTDIVEMLRHQTGIDAAKGQTSGDLSDYVEEHPELENKHKWANLVAGLAGDVAMDPLNAMFPGTAAKSVKDAPKALQDVEFLSKMAERGAELGVLPRTAEGQHALVTEEDIAKVTDEVTKELEAKHHYFDLNRITSATMVSDANNVKKGNQAYKVAKDTLASNLKLREQLVQERLAGISQARALDLPQDERALILKSHFNIDPENPTVGVAGTAANKWQRITRQNRVDLNEEELSQHLNVAHDTIRDITDAERRASIEKALEKVATQESTTADLHLAKIAEKTETQPHLVTDRAINDASIEYRKLRHPKLYKAYDDHQRALREGKALEQGDVQALTPQVVKSELAQVQEKVAHFRTEVEKIEQMGKNARGSLKKKHANMRAALSSALKEEARLKELLKAKPKAKAVAPDKLAHVDDMFTPSGRHVSAAQKRVWRIESGKRFDKEFTYLANRMNDLVAFGTENVERLRRGQQMQGANSEAKKLAATIANHAKRLGMDKQTAYNYLKLSEKERAAYRDAFIKREVKHLEDDAIRNRSKLRAANKAPVAKAAQVKPLKGEKPLTYNQAERARRDFVVNRQLEAEAQAYVKHLYERRTTAKKSFYGKQQKANEKALRNADAMAYRTADEMDKAVRRNLTPEVIRRISIAFPYTDRVVTIPGTGPIVSSARRFLDNPNGRWNRYMRASAGVPSEVNARRLMYTGRAQFRIQQHNRLLFDGWKETTKSERVRAATAWRQNLDVTIANHEGTDLVKWTNAQIDEIEAELVDILGSTAPQQLSRHLPAQLKLFGGEATPHLWTDKSMETLKKGWLKQRLKEVITRQLESPNAMDTHKDYLNDMSKIVGSLRAATEQAKTFRLMRDDFIQNFGHSVRKTIQVERVKKDGKWVTNTTKEDDALTKSLRNKGYREVKIVDYHGAKATTPPDMKGVLFSPDVADGIEGIYKIISNHKIVKDYFEFYDKNLRVWKTAITRYNPGYHERNLMGELFTAWLGGVKDPRLFARAIKVLRQHDTQGAFKESIAAESTMNKRAKKIANMLHEDPVAASQEAARIMEPGELTNQTIVKLNNGKSLTIDEVYHMFTQEAGLHTGFLASDVAEGVGSGRFGGVGRMVGNFNRAAQGFTEGIEDSVRMMHFLDALSKSKKLDIKDIVQEAAAEVRKFHHDFTDFTDFETNVMARMFPFYKWTRKNLPLMAQTLFTQPGKVDKLFILPMAMSIGLGFDRESGARIPVGGPLTPSWLQDNGAIPIGHAGNGNVQLIDSPLPFLDALKMANHPLESAAFMTTPALKIPFEITTGHTTAGIPTPGWQKYLAGQSPYSNIGLKAAGDEEGLSTALLQFISGIGLQEVTKKRMMSEAIRQASVASAQKTKATGG